MKKSPIYIFNFYFIFFSNFCRFCVRNLNYFVRNISKCLYESVGDKSHVLYYISKIDGKQNNSCRKG